MLATVLQAEHPHAVIEPLLVDPVLALHLAVVAGCSDTDAMVAYLVFFQLRFKQTLVVRIVRDQRLGKLRAVVRLDFTDWEGTFAEPTQSGILQRFRCCVRRTLAGMSTMYTRPQP